MKSNLSIEQTLEQVKNSPSSIFHKDDVMRIISGIEVTKGTTMTLDQLEDIASDIANGIDRESSHIIQIESITVTAGGYGNGIDDVDVAMDEDSMHDIIMGVLTTHITPADEDSTGTENNDADNQAVNN